MQKVTGMLGRDESQKAFNGLRCTGRNDSPHSLTDGAKKTIIQVENLDSVVERVGNGKHCRTLIIPTASSDTSHTVWVKLINVAPLAADFAGKCPFFLTLRILLEYLKAAAGKGREQEGGAMSETWTESASK
jgi:hypothetical protein